MQEGSPVGDTSYLGWTGFRRPGDEQPATHRRRRRAIARSLGPILGLLILLVGLVPAASAAEGLDLTTPYPAVAVAPGSKVSFDLEVRTDTASRVGLEVMGVPNGWTATLKGGGFVINGQKVFCSNAHISEHVLVVCRTTRGESKHEGLSMIFVPTDNAQMEIKPIDTMGGRETNYLYLTDCEAPADAVLGEVDQGWMQLMAGLNVERLILAATMLGIGQRAFDDALAYVKERRQFGKPIGSFQVIQQNLAVLAGHTAAAGTAAANAFRAADRGDAAFEIAVAKVRVGEAAGIGASIAHQTHGAIGFTYEHALQFVTRRLWSWRAEFGGEGEWAVELGRSVAERGADALWPHLTAR